VLLVSLIPAALGVLSILIVLLYPLDEAKVKEMEQDLRRRREEADAKPPVTSQPAVDPGG